MSSKKQKNDQAKAEKKAKQKAVEEKSFGLKNKNKSKTVQNQITNMKKAVQGNPRKQELDGKEQKRLKKLAEREREKELKELFNVIPSKEDLERQKLEEEKKAAEAAAAGEEQKEEEIKEEEIFQELDKIEEELDEEEDMSLEEIIEKERAKIVDPVPVTEESFKKWKQFKLLQQEKENERLRKLEEQSFKKSGSGISGKHLFEMDQTVFVDDADADDKVEKVEDENADVEQDDSLFLDGEEDGAAAGDEDAPAEEEEDSLNYNEDTWEDKANPPKNQLMDLLAKKKIKVLPKYESVPVAIGQLAKCILPHLDNKEFLPSKVYNTKKAAEHNAALFALRFLQEEDAKAEAPAQ